jgi:leucyl/phenylalanyl-tRNA---protein transferase
MKREIQVREELQPPTLIAAYAAGAFPMPDPDDESRILWFSPDPRGLLPLDERFHISRRLARTIRQGKFVCTVNADFAGVMSACAQRDEGTWITPEFLAAYGQLRALGLAHSVEAWAVCDGRPDFKAGIAGGLYGVAVGKAFFAESMFHRVTDAGKVALAALVGRLRERGYLLCDTQWLTPNLARFGGFELSRRRYLTLLKKAIGQPARFD